MRVSPFRHPRITGYLLLPAAFRSLSRLSSALSAKASTLRSSSLNLFRSFLLFLEFSFFPSAPSVALPGRLFLVLLRPSGLPVLLAFLDVSSFLQYSVFKVQRNGFLTFQWRLRDSNSRPPACKAGALPAELSPLMGSGSRLLSRTVSSAVPSAAPGLTFVFGMGTGVSPERIATGILICLFLNR